MAVSELEGLRVPVALDERVPVAVDEAVPVPVRVPVPLSVGLLLGVPVALDDGVPVAVAVIGLPVSEGDVPGESVRVIVGVGSGE